MLMIQLMLAHHQRHAYLTKPVILENPTTALDIRLTQNVRSSSSVEVYFRTSSSEEARD